jgi:hypothetical protein
MVNAVSNLVRKSVNDPKLVAQARADGVNFFSAHSQTPFEDNATGRLFVKNGLISKLRAKNDAILFHGYGNKVAIGTYKYVLDHPPKGISVTEARKLATSLANETIMNMRPHEQSVAVAEAGKLILFATKFLASTIRVGTRAAGIGLDKTLSTASQRSMQKTAIKNLARGFAWSFGTAQAINIRATGHPTWQNDGSKLSPVYYIDKKTGKEYHISNFYGQVGDLIKMAGNTIPEFTNKLAPGIQEVTKQIANYDQYKGGNIVPNGTVGLTALIDRLTHVADSLFTPAGFSQSGTNVSTPAAVTVAKLAGFSSSTVNQTPMGKDIANRYYAMIPSGAPKTPPAMSVMESAARNDLSKGIKNSQNVADLKATMTAAAFTKFMKTGADTATQRQFDGLSDKNKMQIIQKYSPNDLKNLDIKPFMESLASKKATYQSLINAGFTDQQIQAAVNKAGYGGQLNQLQAEAKRQAAINARNTPRQPRYTRTIQ